VNAEGAIGSARAHAPPAAQRRFGAVEWGLTAVLALVWGASFLFIRVGIDAFGSGLVPPLRILFGAAALGSFARSRRPIAREDLGRVALLGFLWMALPFLLFSIAERTVSTAVTGMINGATPLSSAAVFALWQRRRPSARRAAALLAGFAGVSVVAFAATGAAHGTADVPGVVMLFGAIACYGVSANIAPALQQKYGAMPVIFRAQFVAFALSLPYGLWALRTAHFSWVGLFAMVFLGALGTGIAYAILATLVGRTDSTRGTIGVFLTPIVATLLGVFVRHEDLSSWTFVGSALIVAGAFLTSRPERAGP